jgi:hypothetical protein
MVASPILSESAKKQFRRKFAKVKHLNVSSFKLKQIPSNPSSQTLPSELLLVSLIIITQTNNAAFRKDS